MYICSIKYYSAIKKIEVMRFAGKWMDLEKIILSGVNGLSHKKVLGPNLQMCVHNPE